MHAPIYFQVKGLDKNGKVVDGRDYNTPKLNGMNGHWCVVQRMATTVLKNKKVKTVKYFMDGVEYVYDADEYEFKKA